MSNTTLHSNRSTLPPEYLEAVRSMSSGTMNRACEILLQPETNEDDIEDDQASDKASADELLEMYHKCQSAFAVIQQHQPRLSPNLALNSGGSVKAGPSNNTPNAPGAHLSLPMRKKGSMLSAAAASGGSSSGTVSAKHGIMRSKKTLVPHGRRNLNDAISSDSPLAKKARLHGNNNNDTGAEAPPKSALNFLNKLNRGNSAEGNNSSSSAPTASASSSTSSSSSSSSTRAQPPRSATTATAATTTASTTTPSSRSQPSREAKSNPASTPSSSSTPPTRSQPTRSSRRGSTSS